MVRQNWCRYSQCGFFAPLAVTAAVADYNQKKLSGEICDYVEKFLLGGGQSVMMNSFGADMAGENEIICPNCKSANVKDTKFCNQCGNPMQQPDKTCPGCGAEVAADMKFCGECGTKIE